AWPRANAIERPMPELAPVTIAFWPLSNLRFSVFGTTGFGRSSKVCACGIFGFGLVIASGGMVGIGIPFVVLRIRRRDERFLTRRCRAVVAGGVDPGFQRRCYAPDQPASTPPATNAILRFHLAKANRLHLRR